jgi:acyl-coenzyme A synthetase/AMP-(fatty) acid ligase
VASGEALDLDVAVRFERAAPHATLINMYGCSELSNDVTWIDARGCERTGGVPIGKPIANMRVYVLDETQRPVPVGVPGELCAAGAGVNRGYLNRPELTRDKFVPDPFGPPGSRLYRTGDRARWRADGNLEFLGRLDQQVKLRGIRIELGEIEAALARHPQVKQAVVVVRDEGSKRLVAYVVPATDSSLTHEELRGFLKGRLPDYMLPAATVVLPALPLTPSGKVDRRSLPAPSMARSQGQYTEPLTDAERTLAAIWAELLRVDRVGRDDNFFELGGESLLAVQMTARATAAGLSLSPRDLFQRQTIAELAFHIAPGLPGEKDVGSIARHSTVSPGKPGAIW